MKGQVWLPLLVSVACLWAIVTLLLGQEGRRSTPVPTGPSPTGATLPISRGAGFRTAVRSLHLRLSHSGLTPRTDFYSGYSL